MFVLEFLRRRAGAFALCCAAAGIGSPLAAQQDYTLNGRVVEAATQRPLAGVTVRLDESAQVTQTREDGAFTLRVSAQRGAHTVVLTRIGQARVTRDVTLGSATTIDLGAIEMRAVPVQLSEVVVTGTGAPAERRQLGSTVASVQGEAINEAPAAQSVDKALQGKVLGAVITQNNGQPGGGVSIRLRGTGSILGGAEPLIVIDGVLVENNSEALVSLGANANRGGASLTNSLADIAPGDIERIEVVKGAAAAALYGSRANNGVIQIFTKRGLQGAPKVTFRTEAAFGSTPKRYDLNDSPVAGRADVVFTGASAIGAPVTRYDYQDQIFQTSTNLTNQLSVSGGSAQTTFYASLLNQRESGIVRSTGMNNTNVRASITQHISPKLFFNVGGSYIQRSTDFVPEGEQGQGVLTGVIFNPTTFNPAYDAVLGRYPYSPVLGTNALDVIENWEARDEVNRFIGSFNATWLPVSSVTVNYLFGFDRGVDEFKYFQPTRSTSASFAGSIQNPIRSIQRFNNDLTATHEGALRGISTSTTLGFRQTADRSNEVRAAALGLSPGQTTVGAGGATPSSSQGITELRTLGGFLQERLGFGERLFITGGLNMEAASAFGRDERWQMFPRLGASWNVDQEPFWASSFASNFLSTFRLRAAYGETGGQPPSPYSIFDNYSVGSRAGRPALVPSSVSGNPDLKPERQREYEGGFDAAMLDNRASLEFTVYHKRSSDLVLSVPLPLSSGFSSQLQNVGELTNRGIEIGLNALLVNADAFQWNSRLGYSANRSNVEKLVTANDTLVYGYLNAVAVGQPVGAFYGAYYQRDAQGNRVAQGRLSATCAPIAGTEGIIFSRARGANCAVLRKFLGNPEPDFTLTWNNEMNIGRKAQVSFLLDGRFGNEVANFSRRISELFGAAPGNENEQCVVSGGTTYCQLFLNTDRRDIYEEYIEDGSFVKLREIAFRYTLDGPWVSRTGAESLQLTVAGRNLYTWTRYSGIDPEVNLFSANTVARGVEFGTSPIPRQVALGLTVNF